MYKTFYTLISAPFRTERASQRIRLFDKALVYAFALSYAALLAWCFFFDPALLYRSVFIPLITFISLTIVRFALNLPRPYEKYALDPLVTHSTQGKSFPSRHVSSAAIIALSLGHVSLFAGIVTGIGVVLLAALRVIEGAHFPRDVIAGIIWSLILGSAGYTMF